MEKPNKLGCSHPKVVRRSRSGLIDSVMFRFGRYPWICRTCGCRVYYKDRRPGENGGTIRTDTDAFLADAARPAGQQVMQG